MAAASPTLSETTIRGTDKVASTSSYFHRTVCLQDWWLVKAEKDGENTGIGVAGFPSREEPALRQFTSAPIIKRYDVFTLETSDEICIILKGFMNKTRTQQNGFPSRVLNDFLFGFPPNWKECTVDIERQSDVEVSPIGDASWKVSEKAVSENYNKSRHFDNEKRNLGVEYGENTALGTVQYDIDSYLCSNGAPEVLNNITDSSVLRTSKSSAQLKNDVKSCLAGSPVHDRVDSMIHKDVENSPLSLHATVDLGNSSNITMPLDNEKLVDVIECGFDSSLGVGNSCLSSSTLGFKRKDPSSAVEDREVRNSSLENLRGPGEVNASLGSNIPHEKESHEDANNESPIKEKRNKDASYKKCRSVDKMICSKSADEVKENASERECSSANNTESPVAGRGKGAPSFVSVESLNCERSRSGRLLVPPLEFWRNQYVIYDTALVLFSGSSNHQGLCGPLCLANIRR